MTYYYFVGYKIMGFEWEVNTALNPAYTPLTAEQTAFYLEHPNASVYEVKRCALDPEPEPPTLEEVQAEAKKNLSQISLDTLDRFVKVYQLANAQASLYMLEKDPSAETIYDEVRAREIMDTYTNVGKELREMYKNAESDINAAKTVEEVATFEGYYEYQYHTYEYNDPNA